MQRTQSGRISAGIANRMLIFENAGKSLTTTDSNSSNSIGSIGIRGDSSDQHQLLPSASDLGQSEYSAQSHGRTTPTTMMSMSSSPPPSSGVQTDSEGLILPKKLINPCLESTDLKELHRELKFNTKIGKNVLNQKSELQRAYEKQKEKQQLHQQQTQDNSPTAGLKSELNRVIMERAQKHEQHARQQDAEIDDDKQYVNPEYLNARAKLRHGQHSELK